MTEARNGQGDANDFSDSISLTLEVAAAAVAEEEAVVEAGGGNPSSVDLRLDLRTDNYGSETEMWLINDETQEFIWCNWGFDSNQSKQYNACLDTNDGCAIFKIFDSWGDGISEPGGITLTFGGKVVYEGGDFGYGEVFPFGNGC
jgi:hypothetical protein